MPLAHIKALNPITPQSASSSKRSRLCGQSPPHSPKSTCDDCLEGLALQMNDCASSVGGDEFSGMSQKHGPSAGRERRRAAGRSLPVGSTRFVEVDVRIDDAGKTRQAGGIDHLAGFARQFDVDGSDVSIFNSDVGGNDTARQNHPASANHDIQRHDGSTSAVGDVVPGRNQKRHVIGRRGVSDDKLDRHNVEKLASILDTDGTKVIGHVE